MDELRRLEHLSLVSKVCTELDNHYSMNDKDLAEFIIDLANKSKTLAKFKAALLENGAEFSDSFIENLLRIIQHMTPGGAGGKEEEAPRTKLGLLREQLPCLAIPDEMVTREKPAEKKKPDYEEDAAVDNMMGFLESMAPSKSKEESRGARNRSRSRERRRSRSRDRRRSRSRDRKRRSRSRDRDRKRRSRSRDKKRRNRSKSRSRSRSIAV